MKAWTVGSAALGLAAASAMAILAAPGIASPRQADERSGAQARLHKTIDAAIHADGPFFKAEERALIERKCGYAPGSWNGDNFNVNGGVLQCANGRQVDDPEIRALMEVVGERIGRRIDLAMARPEVTRAIDAVAREATEDALRRLRTGEDD